jgi:hypothetical protein
MQELWGSIIGNGSGVVVFLNEAQVSGGMYGNALYQATLAASIADDQIGTQLNQGIWTNTNNNKFSILKIIKDATFKIGISPDVYFYGYNTIAYNPTATAADVISYMQSNNVNGFLTLPNTITLADTGTDFLSFFL